MTPAAIELIATALIKYGPGVARALVEIFSHPAPTREAWEKVFAMAEKPYDAYVAPIKR